MICAREPRVPGGRYGLPSGAGPDVLVLAVDAAGTREALDVAAARACATSGRVILAGPMVRPLWWALAVGSWMMSPQVSPAETAAAERQRLCALVDGLPVAPIVVCGSAAPETWVPLLLERGRIGMVLIGAAGRRRRVRRQVSRHRQAIGSRCDAEVLPVAVAELERGLRSWAGPRRVAPTTPQR